MAAGQVSIAWNWLSVTLLAFFCMEVAKNAWGDVIDYDSGTDLRVKPEDRTPFSGGKRVLVDNLLTRAETWSVAAVSSGIGLALGVLIVFVREPGVFWIGFFGLLLGWSYHGPPLKLCYRGFGELAVIVIYGPTIALATFVILAGEADGRVIWLSLPLGIVIAAFLWINQLPDYAADKVSGKNNLVVRLGKPGAARVYPLLYVAAAGLTLALPCFGLPRATWLGLCFLVPAAYACAAVWRNPDGFHRTTPAQPAALLAFLLCSLGTGTGLLIV